MGININESSKAFFRRVIVQLDNARIVNQQFNSELDFPMKGIRIINASSDNAKVDLAINWPHDRGSYFPMKNGELFNFPEKINGCRLVYSAQPGEWVEFLVSIETDLPQANSRLNIAGSIKTLEGNFYSVTNPLLDIALTSTLLFPQNTARGVMNVYNNSAYDMLIGPSTYELLTFKAGTSINFKNTSAMYAKAVGTLITKTNIILWEETF